MEVGGTMRVGADQVLTYYMGLLRKQRAELAEPRVVVDLACPAGRSDAPPPPQTPHIGRDGITDAVVCARDHGRYQTYRSALRMSPDDLAVIARDLRRPSAPIKTFPPDCPEYLDTLILAQNTWGDVVAINPVCERYIGPAATTGGSAVWRQSPRAHRALERLVDEALAQ